MDHHFEIGESACRKGFVDVAQHLEIATLDKGQRLDQGRRLDVPGDAPCRIVGLDDRGQRCFAVGVPADHVVAGTGEEERLDRQPAVDEQLPQLIDVFLARRVHHHVGERVAGLAVAVDQVIVVEMVDHVLDEEGELQPGIAFGIRPAACCCAADRAQTSSAAARVPKSRVKPVATTALGMELLERGRRLDLRRIGHGDRVEGGQLVRERVRGTRRSPHPGRRRRPACDRGSAHRDLRHLPSLLTIRARVRVQRRPRLSVTLERQHWTGDDDL